MASPILVFTFGWIIFRNAVLRIHHISFRQVLCGAEIISYRSGSDSGSVELQIRTAAVSGHLKIGFFLIN
jgi:hypothetical protein